MRGVIIVKNANIDEAPRKQHYYFARVYLRDRAFQHPKLLIDELREESGSKYLKIRWAVQAMASKEKDADIISHDGLECFPIEIGNEYYGVLVQFPKPERIAEAYFVAVILPVRADASTKAYFYTLEFGKNEDGSERTVLGHWSPGIHSSLVNESEPEREAFVQAISELILT